MRIIFTQSEINEIVKKYIQENLGLTIIEIISYQPYTVEVAEKKIIDDE